MKNKYTSDYFLGRPQSKSALTINHSSVAVVAIPVYNYISPENYNYIYWTINAILGEVSKQDTLSEKVTLVFVPFLSS